MDTALKIIEDISAFGLTDKAIADSVDSTQPTIWRIRTGETQDCSASLYINLSNFRQKLGAGDTAKKAA